jgi:hypothetical protein
VVPLRAEFLDTDLTLVYMGARIGLGNGWSHIYSVPLQQQVFSELRPDAPWHTGTLFLATPPYAWLLAPMVPLGAETAVAAWLAVALVALIAAWWIAAPGAGSGPRRVLWLLGALAWYPVLYALSLVQPDSVVLVLAAAAWKLSEKGRPYLAGAVLGLTVIKPQLLLLLPLVLLTSGRWRVVAGWLAVAGTLALLSLLSLGAGGLADYRSILSLANQVANNRYFTAAYVLGPGTLSYVFSAALIVVAAFAGYLNRHSSTARVFALGLVATAIAATYWHLQDFTMLVLAAWLFWRDDLPASSRGPHEITPKARISWGFQRWWLLVVVVGGELAWGLTPLPVLVGVAVWFGFLVAPPRAARVMA